MAVIKVASIPKKSVSKRELYATLCYYYPQYTLKEASKLPGRDVTLLLKTAQKMEAIKMMNLTQIAAAPHSKNGRSVKKIADYFKRIIDG